MFGSGTLVIKPTSAQLTYSTEFLGKMDCYCTITVGGNVFRTMPAHDQGKHPNWQQVFNARVTGEQTMHVSIFDHDNVTKDDYVGECTVPLQDVYTRRNTSNWYTVNRKGRSIGQIMILLEFYPDGAGGMGGMNGMGMGMNNMGMGGMGMNNMGMGMGMNGMGGGMGMNNMGMGGMGMGTGMGMGMGGMGMGNGMGMGGMGMGGMNNMGMGGYGGMGGMGGMGGYGY